MLLRRSPPKHRHDGSSPLPLGMDWSPPPKKWTGRNTVWPHDPSTGWSYCVMIPSWVFQPETGSTEDNMTNPIVFYRVQVGMQSPEGLTTSHIMLRRFSDFLRLFSELKRAFPRKVLPQPPPKHAFLRINSSRPLLEERRYALEEWMGKLLSDIDLSRSVQAATFLELESAARASFANNSQNGLDSNYSNNHLVRSFRAMASTAGDSLSASATQSVASDCGSDSAYEASETEIIGQVQNYSALSTKSVQELSSGRITAQYGVSIDDSYSVPSEPILDRPESSSGCKISNRNTSSGDDLKGTSSLPGDGTEFLPVAESEKHVFHTRKLSSESAGSEMSSLRGSELSNSGISPGDTFVDISESEVPGTADAFNNAELSHLKNAQIVLPLDQRHKLNRILVIMQQRLVTAKTDMEDLMARLNQEIAVKEYLTTKVKDMEVELETTRQRSKENLHQAITSEREKVTQMQWEMDELRRKSQELESKFKFEQNERINADSSVVEKEIIVQELNAKDEELTVLRKRLEDLEHKSKSDIKVLSKEVKSLRNSQVEMKEKLSLSLKEKSELEGVHEEERKKWRKAKLARRKLLHECALLRCRLQECSVDFVPEDEFTLGTSSPSDALDSLATSDNRIGLLLAEAQLLADEDSEDVDVNINNGGELPEIISTANGDDLYSPDDEVRKMLTDTLVDNATLRKRINSITRCALKTLTKSEIGDEEDTPRKTIFNKFFDR